MRITILGASGKVGQLLTTALLSRGHEITAFVHNKPLTDAGSESLRIVSGDVNNIEDLKKAINGSGVVVSCLGSWGTKKKDIVSAATKNVIPAMESAGIKRIISVTGGAARTPNEIEPFIQKATRSLLGLIAKPILFDAEEHLRLLTLSDLDWTAIRSPVMTNNKSDTFKLTMDSLAPWAMVSRHAVVKALIEVVENNTFIKQAPYIIKK